MPIENQRHNLFIRSLQNQHAIEKKSIQFLEQQIIRLGDYLEFSKRIRTHVSESKAQIQRLECVLRAYKSDYYSEKNATYAFMGNLTALSHVIIEEDVIKNFFVNLAFENFEIATYHALLTLADLCGDRTAQQALKLSLNEEKSMATFVEEKIDPTIRTYIAKRKNEEQPLH
ncbi:MULTISPECIES: DUF892 family protein [Komagataeibacter]|uniref:DUF892 family protein n=1 Tax=Komagataeibacter TaxID=1434011 RepID=UPI000366E919|nr:MULTISPECIES: DUF892 family protein [Komagataeibacter]AZV40469.1 DUF892 domain-containing protein [Komagataeibacter xylinus]